MCYNTPMNAVERLTMLTSQMQLEPAEERRVGGINLPPKTKKSLAVSSAVTPNGGSIRLLKTLLSSYCENDCRYCPFRAQRDQARTAFQPNEFAHLFLQLYQAGLVEGIFLSSGVFQSPTATQDQLLDTAAILRRKLRFRGYLHLKIMPGAKRAQVEEAMLLADRLSINLEAPHQGALAELAPGKHLYQDLLAPLQWMEDIRQNQSPYRAWKKTWPSSTTQFVVGAAGETDLDLLSMTSKLSGKSGVSRAYFSSFTPISGTPLENTPASDPRREFRLYQASFLLRDYHFTLEDIPFLPSGLLSLNTDPKTAWADAHLKQQPLEINTAAPKELLKIPGIGPARQRAILVGRRRERITSVDHLKALGAYSSRSLPYILLNGRLPMSQLALF